MNFMKALIYTFFLIIITLDYSCNHHRQIEKIGDLTVLHLYGSSYERGLAHGKILKHEIEDITTRWKIEVERTYQADFQKVVSSFLRSTSYVDTIQVYCPELMEEVRGISDGSGIDYETILAFQMSEEIDVLSDELEGKHCTSIGVSKTDSTPAFLAQNMDPPLFLHGFPVLLHNSGGENNPESYIYTFPGFIGLTGMNSKGVAVTCMSMSMLNHSLSGLPVSFILRTILNKSGEKAAIDFIQKVPIATPQCFIIGGMSELRCFECSANQKTEFYPFDSLDVCLHTNFSVKNRDFNDEFVKLLAEYNKTVDDPYYCPRYFLAYDKIVEYNFSLNYETIRSILSLAEPKIEPISNKYTYGSLIMELSDKPVLYISPGRPDSTGYIKLMF